MPFPKKNKFNAKRTLHGGRWYDSKLEADYRKELELRVEAGDIFDLEDQPKVVLTRAGISYKADFKFTEDGHPVWVDVKGVEADRFRLIKKLWRYYGPGLLRVIKRKGTKFYTAQEIMTVEYKKELEYQNLIKHFMCSD